MTPGTPAAAPYTAARFFALVDEGVLHPDDRVELLEGVIVSVSPRNPPHASAVYRTSEALRAVLVTTAPAFGGGTVAVDEILPGRVRPERRRRYPAEFVLDGQETP